jgi:hypothetical protein
LVPTPAQAAVTASFQTIRWEKQGLTFKVPPGWTKGRDDPFFFSVNAPDAVRIDAGTSSGLAPSLGVLVSREKISNIDAYLRSYLRIVQEPKEGATTARLIDVSGLHGVLVEYAKSPDPADNSGLTATKLVTARTRDGHDETVFITVNGTERTFAAQRDTFVAILLSARVDP